MQINFIFWNIFGHFGLTKKEVSEETPSCTMYDLQCTIDVRFGLCTIFLRTPSYMVHLSFVHSLNAAHRTAHRILARGKR